MWWNNSSCKCSKIICSSIYCSFKCAYQCNKESLQKRYLKNPTVVERQLGLHPIQEMMLLIPISMLIPCLYWFSHWLLGMLDFLLLFPWKKLWWRYSYIIIWKWGRVQLFLAPKVRPQRKDSTWNHMAFISPWEALWQKSQKEHFLPQNWCVLWCPGLIRQSTPTSSVRILFALRQEGVSSLKALNVFGLVQCYDYYYCFYSCCCSHCYCDPRELSRTFSFVFISEKLNFATRKK